MSLIDRCKVRHKTIKKKKSFIELRLLFLFRHPIYARAFCIRCGVKESVNSEKDLREKYQNMDFYLKASKKKRKIIRGDGHCLPRAVFNGAKLLNLMPNVVTYSALLKAAANRIRLKIKDYSNFLTDNMDDALNALDRFVFEKKYQDESNIIDAVVVALAQETSCKIKIHYEDIDGSMDSHMICNESSTNDGMIELAFISGHYDLVVKDVVKHENQPVVNQENTAKVIKSELLEDDLHSSAEEDFHDDDRSDFEVLSGDSMEYYNNNLTMPIYSRGFSEPRTTKDMQLKRRKIQDCALISSSILCACGNVSIYVELNVRLCSSVHTDTFI